MTKKKTTTKTDKVALIIMIKNPVLGKAKTRIASTTGDEEALRIYKLLLAHTRDVTSKTSFNKYLYYSDQVENDQWSEKIYNKRVQSNGDLGHRLRSAFSELSEEYSRMIVIGSDCAEITPEHIETAAQALNDNDIVLGPVYDGGYYLLGMKGYHPEVITDIEWSTDVVAEQTISKAKSKGLSFQKIKMLHDIDYHEDWLSFGLE